jgi:hypothetical protein
MELPCLDSYLESTVTHFSGTQAAYSCYFTNLTSKSLPFYNEGIFSPFGDG